MGLVLVVVLLLETMVLVVLVFVLVLVVLLVLVGAAGAGGVSGGSVGRMKFDTSFIIRLPSSFTSPCKLDKSSDNFEGLRYIASMT